MNPLRAFVGVVLFLSGVGLFLYLSTQRGQDSQEDAHSPTATLARLNRVEDVNPPRKSEPAEAQFPADAQVVGNVHDEKTASPIPGVALSISPLAENAGAPIGVASNDHGEFYFNDLQPGRYKLVCQADIPYPILDEVSVLVEVPVSGPPVRVDFPLRRGLVASGIVVDEAGTPVSGASVTGRHVSMGPLGLETETLSIHSDPMGQFTIGAFRPESNVYISAIYETRTSPWIGPINAEADLVLLEVSGLTLRLVPGARVQGMVMTTSSKQLPFANVHARSAADDATTTSSYDAVAGEDGAFEIAVTLPGKYLLTACPPELESAGAQTETSVELAEGQSVHDVIVVFDDKDGLDISGRVHDAHNELIAVALITVEGPIEYTAYTGEDGSFRIPYLATGEYTVHAAHPGFVVETQSCAAGTHGLDFTLKTLGDIELRVIDKETGAPVAQFEVTEESAGGIVKTTERVVNKAGSHVITPDKLFFGRMALLKLPTEPVFTLRVDAEGYSQQSVEIPFQELLDSPRKSISIQLTVKEANRINGIVVTETDEPIEGAGIFVRAPDDDVIRQGPPQMHSDHEGRFVVETSSEGMYALSAVHPSYAPGGTFAQPGEEARLVLSQAGMVRGTVRRAGLPVAGARVVVVPQDVLGAAHNIPKVMTGPDGVYANTSVPPGRTGVRAKIGPKSQAKTVTVSSGQVTTVDFDFESKDGCEISGHVTIEGKAPAQFSVQLILAPEEGTYNLAMQSAFDVFADCSKDGAYEIKGSPAGSGTLFVRGQRDRQMYQRRIPIELEPGEIETVDVDLAHAATLVGFVSGNYRVGTVRAFRGVIDVESWLELLPRRGWSDINEYLNDYYDGGTATFSRDDGFFEIEDMEVGTYTLGVLTIGERGTVDDFVVTSVVVDVEEGKDNRVDIALE